MDQLKALIDLCHLSGIAVVFDIVFNHVGNQVIDQPDSLWFFDLQDLGDDNRSQYFTSERFLGPVPALWKKEVRQFLIDNAGFFIDEYHTCNEDEERWKNECEESLRALGCTEDELRVEDE